MNFRAKIFLIIVGCLIAAACGSPGEPLPPSLELPRPVTDLRAARKGNVVTLSWSLPTLTTEGRTVTQEVGFSICRALVPMQECDAPIAQLPKRAAQKSSATQTNTYVDVLSASAPGDALANFYYAVSALNAYHRTAVLSNQVAIPAVPTLPAPEELRSRVTAEGVQLTWRAATSVPEYQSLKFIYRVHRREAGTNADVIAGEVPVADNPSPSLIDRGFEWEKAYDYWVSVATSLTAANGNEEQVEGDDSTTVQVTAHDVFPPATPTGLQAVFSGPGQKPFIDLVWNANSESDLAGYNVYRHEAGTQAAKINQELVKSPACRDTDVVPGHDYVYSVSAVDVRGNESSRSDEARESVPAQ